MRDHGMLFAKHHVLVRQKESSIVVRRSLTLDFAGVGESSIFLPFDNYIQCVPRECTALGGVVFWKEIDMARARLYLQTTDATTILCCWLGFPTHGFRTRGGVTSCAPARFVHLTFVKHLHSVGYRVSLVNEVPILSWFTRNYE